MQRLLFFDAVYLLALTCSDPGAEHSFDPPPLLPPSIRAEPAVLSSFPEPCAVDLPLESLPLESPGLAQLLNAAPKDLTADQKEPPSPQQVEEARVREVPVTAVILAAKSTFFMKLFTTGMRETVDKRVVTVHLTAKGGLPPLSLPLDTAEC